METRTKAQLGTDVEVLNKPGERLNTRSEHSVMQPSESLRGNHYAGRPEVEVVEQPAHRHSNEERRNRMLEQRRQCVSHHV